MKKRIFTYLPRFDGEGDESSYASNAENGGNKSGRSGSPRRAPFKKAGRGEAIPRRISAVKEELLFRMNSDGKDDLIIREFDSRSGGRFLLAYMNGMADDSKINEFILKPLMEHSGRERGLEELLKSAVEIAEAKIETGFDAAISAVIGGMTALFSEGEGLCILLETRGFEKRGVDKAENESIVLGPKESFSESLRTNVTLLRRIVRRRDLIVTQKQVGKNGVSVAIAYIKGRADERLLSALYKRLNEMDTDALLSGGVLEQLIEDRSPLPLPKTLATERPDRAASHILNGRICILLEGSPFATVLPITLFSLLNSPEDVYMRPPLGTLIRLVRYAGALVSVLMPGYFLALALYHQGMLTTEVLSTVVASRKMVFEPIGVEMLLLLFIFQMIREAGLRVPGPIGQAIGIIGGLIMGQAAVTAHLASSVVLIIVAASGLGNFCIPDYSTQIAASYFRAAAVIAAWLGGLLAMTAASILTVALLADMKSFGLPYLTPLSPKRRSSRPPILRGRIGNGNKTIGSGGGYAADA